MEKVTLILCFIVGSVVGDDYVHHPIQYHSQSDRGGYNFGYDTGLSGSHQFHQESKDDFGVVRGRYGYTDPNGKLRLVYYSSDAVNGYKAWGPDIPETTNSKPQPLKVQESKVSSRFVYPQSPASKVSALKSAKVIVPLPPAKTVQREQVVHKTHYSPADTFRSRYTSSSVISKTSSSIKQAESKGAPIIVQQRFQSPAAAIKSQSIVSANRPIPITPVQYRSNYPPAGKYSRCYCE